jgi:hypothetical protein
MEKKTNHVVPARSSGWSVKKSGATKASRIFETKDEAIQYGRSLSKTEKTELYIHKKNGMIQNRNSYGNDPNPPKDKK